MEIWKVCFNDRSIKFGRRLNFYKTTDIHGVKWLPYKWFLNLDRNTVRERHYKIFENVQYVYAPDGEELSDTLFIVFAERNEKAPENLGDGYIISNEISSKIGMVGYIIGLSTANEVGIFGLWPQSFYKISRKRPNIMVLALILICDKPVFWRKVLVAAKAGLLDKLRL